MRSLKRATTAVLAVMAASSGFRLPPSGNPLDPRDLATLDAALGRVTRGIACVQFAHDGSPFAQAVVAAASNGGSLPPVKDDPGDARSFCNTYLYVTEELGRAAEMMGTLVTPVRYLTVCVFRFSIADISNRTEFRHLQIVLIPLNGNQQVHAKHELEFEFHQFSPYEVMRPVVDTYSGKTITVTTFNCTIFSQYSLAENNSWADGIEMKFMQLMTGHLNLTLRIHTSEYEFGEMYPNGSYSKGSIKYYLAEGLVDLGFCELWISSDFYSRVDTIRPWHKCCSRYLVPKPTGMEVPWGGLGALPPSFWAITTVAAILSTPTIYWFSRTTAALLHRPGYSSLAHCFMDILSSFMHGNTMNTKYLYGSSSYLVFSWSMLNVLAVAIYSSNLVSQLTRPVFQEKVQTVDQMVKRGWTWSFDHIIENPEYFFPNYQGDPVVMKWLNRFQLDRSVDQRVARMNSRKFAIHGESVGNIFFVVAEVNPPERVANTYEASDYCLADYDISIILRRWSTFTPVFRTLFSRICDAGLREKIFSDIVMTDSVKRFVVKNAFDMSRYTDQTESLKITMLSGAFYLLLIGYSLSLVLFLLECLCNRKTMLYL